MVSEFEAAQLCPSAALCFELEADTKERNYSFGSAQKSWNKSFFGQKMEVGFN